MNSARPFIAVVLLVGGCVSTDDLPSRWPTADFHIDVRGIVTDADGTRQKQRWQVWGDGFAIYRRSERTLTRDLPVPVFDTLSVYQLHPKSIRALGRLLFRAGLFTGSTADDEGRNPRGQHVVISWTALSSAGQVDSFRSESGALDRAVHIINSYLPADCAFGYRELAGDPVDSHVSRVPTPSTSLSGALDWHRKLVERLPGDVEAELELLAIAYSAKEFDEVRALIARIEGQQPTAQVRAALPFLDWELDIIVPLRRLLEEG